MKERARERDGGGKGRREWRRQTNREKGFETSSYNRLLDSVMKQLSDTFNFLCLTLLSTCLSHHLSVSLFHLPPQLCLFSLLTLFYSDSLIFFFSCFSICFSFISHLFILPSSVPPVTDFSPNLSLLSSASFLSLSSSHVPLCVFLSILLAKIT